MSADPDSQLALLEASLGCAGLQASTEFELNLITLLRRFYLPVLGRKVLFERLQALRSIPRQYPKKVLDQLESDKKIIQLSAEPLQVLITPVGLWHLYSVLRPGSRSTYLDILISRLEDLCEERLRDTLKAFSATPLTWREIGAVLFLVYNDSTSESRGKYVRSEPLWIAIDKIVQAFVKNDDRAQPSRHLDGAPGRWYLGEANRKLGNAIRIETGSYYVRPDRLELVLERLRRSISALPTGAADRFKAFEVAFSREKAILAGEGVLFANSESIQRCRDLFIR